jgi:hypothetical protein
MCWSGVLTGTDCAFKKVRDPVTGLVVNETDPATGESIYLPEEQFWKHTVKKIFPCYLYEENKEKKEHCASAKEPFTYKDVTDLANIRMDFTDPKPIRWGPAPTYTPLEWEYKCPRCRTTPKDTK